MLFATLLGLLPACSSSPDFAPESKVETVRILATKADKSYALPGDTVTLETLAFDGRKDTSVPMTVYWFPTPCIDPEGDGHFACYPSMTRGQVPGVDISATLQTGARLSFQVPVDIIANHQGNRGDVPYGVAIVFLIACAGHVEYVLPPPDSGPDALPFGCFAADHTRLGPDAYVFAYSTVFAFTNRTNANPTIDHLTFGGAAVDPVAGITVARCTQTSIDNCPTTPLDTVVPASSQEVDPGNTDADGNVLKEQIFVDYLLTSGKVRNDVAVLYDPRDGRLASADDFYAPQSAGDSLLWAIVRDNRGGTAWLQVPIHTK